MRPRTVLFYSDITTAQGRNECDPVITHPGALDGAPGLFSAPTRVQWPARPYAASRSRRQAALAFFSACDARLPGYTPVAARRTLQHGSPGFPFSFSNFSVSLRRHRLIALAAYFVRRWIGAWFRRPAGMFLNTAAFSSWARRAVLLGAPHFH